MGVANVMLMVSLAMMLSYSRADMFVTLAPPPTPTPSPPPPPPPPPTPPGSELKTSFYFNLKYDLALVNISDPKEVTSTTKEIEYSPSPTEVVVPVEFKDETSLKWSSTGESPMARESTVISRIPYLDPNNKIGFTVSEGEFRWNVTQANNPLDRTATLAVPVPAFSFGYVKTTVTTTEYEIPFYYTRRETYDNGTTSSNYLKDGIFTGVRSAASIIVATYQFPNDKVAIAANYAGKIRSFVA